MPRPGDALLIIDMQNDFLPGGALPVPGGNELIPLINKQATLGFTTVVASRDWHPENHCSFIGSGGKWPPHCVKETNGAAFAPSLLLPPGTHILSKGTYPECESYSAFKDENGTSTGLEGSLRSYSIRRVFLCGVALDYCVKASALDSVKAGFETHLLPDLTRSIGKAMDTLEFLWGHDVRIE
ncbi:nicotinamidase [Acetobacteraceae bacterium ESL0697]|nr:nicotinamidase [Acetobacteraceae bacterium ESL0697]